MVEQNRGRKPNGAANGANPAKPTTLTGRVRLPSDAPALTNHFLPTAGGDKPFTVFDLADYLVETEQWPAASLEAAQLQQATELIRYAQKYAPFYKDRLAGLVPGPKEWLTAEAFAAIPFLTREEVQRAGKALFATKLPRNAMGKILKTELKDVIERSVTEGEAKR